MTLLPLIRRILVIAAMSMVFVAMAAMAAPRQSKNASIENWAAPSSGAPAVTAPSTKVPSSRPSSIKPISDRIQPIKPISQDPPVTKNAGLQIQGVTGTSVPWSTRRRPRSC